MPSIPEPPRAAAITLLDVVAEARLMYGFDAAARLAQELGVALPPEDEPIDLE